MSEKFHVYAANCAWHGPIEKAGSMKVPAAKAVVGGREIEIGGEGSMGLPCCPHCQSALFQLNEEEFWDGAKKYEQAGHPGYVDLLKWTMAQPRCWPTATHAAMAYLKETGIAVKL